MADEHKAKLTSYNVPISTKQSVEICNFIRGRNTTQAKALLQKAITQEIAIPYRRYVQEMPHRKGKIATGKYPVNACTHIIKLISAVEANADNVGLNTTNLVISHISAHKASNTYHSGRQRRVKMKQTHIKIEVEEKAEKKATPKQTKKKATPKKEVKPQEDKK